MPVSGAPSTSRKRKGDTNEDPNAERKRQKLEELQKKKTKTAPTKKKPTTTASKKTVTTKKVAERRPRHPSVDVEEVSDKAHHPTPDSNDGNTHEDPTSEPIVIDDDEDTVEVVEEPEESAEAELRMCLFFVLAELMMILI